MACMSATVASVSAPLRAPRRAAATRRTAVSCRAANVTSDASSDDASLLSRRLATVVPALALALGGASTAVRSVPQSLQPLKLSPLSTSARH